MKPDSRHGVPIVRKGQAFARMAAAPRWSEAFSAMGSKTGRPRWSQAAWNANFRQPVIEPMQLGYAPGCSRPAAE